MRQVIRADGIPFLVAMATSEHLVMQNEALVSLTLIAATVLGKSFLLPENPDFTSHPLIVVSSLRLRVKKYSVQNPLAPDCVIAQDTIIDYPGRGNSVLT